MRSSGTELGAGKVIQPSSDLKISLPELQQLGLNKFIRREVSESNAFLGACLIAL
jgi:hypothetical protein